MNGPDMMDLILNAHIKAKTMTTPPCRICNQSGPVICYPDDHSQTICPECCDKTDHQNGEKGHEWKHNPHERGHECDHCGILRRLTDYAYGD